MTIGKSNAAVCVPANGIDGFDADFADGFDVHHLARGARGSRGVGRGARRDPGNGRTTAGALRARPPVVRTVLSLCRRCFAGEFRPFAPYRQGCRRRSGPLFSRQPGTGALFHHDRDPARHSTRCAVGLFPERLARSRDPGHQRFRRRSADVLAGTYSPAVFRLADGPVSVGRSTGHDDRPPRPPSRDFTFWIPC